jgi:hypothetical protein
MELTLRVDRLETGLADLAAALTRLTEAQARTEAGVEQLAAGQRDLLAAQARTEEGLRELAAAQARTDRRLDQLAEAQARTEGRLEELAAAQARTEGRLEELAAAQARTEDGLRGLTAALRDLTTAQQRGEERLDTLIQWQQGERGRRQGERYERQIAQNAPNLFAGGRGGPLGDRLVQHDLMALLAAQGQDGYLLDLDSYDNVFAAVLVWWTGAHLALVEVSNVVEKHDVDRAFRRAQALRRAGADALPMVIGESWADGETRVTAELNRLAWKVGNDLSPSFIAFRRLPVPPPSTG